MDTNILNLRIASGSTNDQFMWNTSNVRMNLWNLRNNGEICHLIDGGYTLSPVLLTPENMAVPGTPEMAYSNSLRTTRCKIEQINGILKGMWRCLCNLRGLHYTPQFATEIIQACVILHIFRKNNDVPTPRLPVCRGLFQQPDNDPHSMKYFRNISEILERNI
ncbi:putative nuclease HARBI1 isoform X2 [Nasonia vitripennis]|uniref:DDE Tnp4 domain-containing protein n=1 Tax=Nasonia vitripennis TaxID=7425 RepID=A0A7M7PVN6_NASVI|nr:putative nuclease HARBI1 isoform X2 [Nasonia vitripennis]